MPIIETKNLTYIYGQGTPFEKVAVEDVSISIEKGEFVGVIGHTGSGKSTLIQTLNGLIRPTSGQVLLDGKDIWAEPKKIRSVRFRVGMVFQYPEYQLFEETVLKDIMFGPKNMGLSDDEARARAYEAARFTDLKEELLEKSPFELSGGEKRRAAIAGVIAMDPEVLILDEPTVGLDPKQIIEIRTLIKNLGRNHTVILSSHILPEVQAVCERIIVINNGRLVADGATDTLAHDLSQDHRLIMRAEGPEREILHALEAMERVVDVYSLGEKEEGAYDFSVESAPDVDIRRDLFALMARNGWPILALKNTDLTLEDLFLQLTSTDAPSKAGDGKGED